MEALVKGERGPAGQDADPAVVATKLVTGSNLDTLKTKVTEQKVLQDAAAAELRKNTGDANGPKCDPGAPGVAVVTILQHKLLVKLTLIHRIL
ncbi:MAG: hypothetical protein PV340_05035 [Wolbachia sp.]|nr:hypothetical protein [Wolbachia sp.]MDD9336364.1 hypothetical protein [Wolbachia sp.]